MSKVFIDTKGRELIEGAWYAVWCAGQDAGCAQLLEWDGAEFLDEEGEPVVIFYDANLDVRVADPDFICLQQCKAADLAGVNP